MSAELAIPRANFVGLRFHYRAHSAGGNIVRPIFEFPAGRRFHFADRTDDDDLLP